MANIIPFHEFCESIIGLKLTTGQSVIAKCVFGDCSPADLRGPEHELAQEMFGGVEHFPAKVKRVIYLRLGRGSGKTSIASAWNAYASVAADITRCGPGDVPVAVTVAPDKATAKLSIRMTREMMRGSSALNALVEESSEESILVRRPDGRRVAIEAFAASRGGSSVRGRSILTFLLDEAEFFRSDDAGSYVINDRDIYGALMPRLLPEGRGIFLSTPWPVETMMSEEFEKNFSHPVTAIAARATTLQMRGEDPQMAEIVNQELERDPDNAKREYFCELDGTSGGEFFDAGSLSISLDTSGYPIPRNTLWPAAAGCDFAFKADSSTICISQFDGKKYRLSESLELRPRRGQPLKPSEVCREFANVLRRYNISSVVTDAHYREAMREHLNTYGINIIDAPEGSRGKLEVYTRTKAVLNEGLITIPDTHDGKRLIEQAKTVVAKPTAGGLLTIKTPRRVGLAHGDLVSAWTLSVHALSYATAKTEPEKRPVYGSAAWAEWTKQQELKLDAERERKYLRNLEKQAKEERALDNKIRYAGIF